MGWQVACERSFTSGEGARVPDGLADCRVIPGRFRSDHGPEFVTNALQRRNVQNGVATGYRNRVVAGKILLING